MPNSNDGYTVLLPSSKNVAAFSCSVMKPASKDGGGGATRDCLLEEQGTGEFGGIDHEFFHHHTLFVGYNVINTLYNTIKEGGGSGGLLPKFFYKCTSDDAGKMPRRKLIQGCQENLLVEG